MSKFDWTGSGAGTSRAYTHPTGWRVAHCGHPTAHWPWFVVSPEDAGLSMLLAECGFSRNDLVNKDLWTSKIRPRARFLTSTTSSTRSGPSE